MISAAVVGLGVALHRGVRSLVRGVAALPLAACFYIDPVNTAPSATIQVTPGPYHIHDAHPTVFSAVARDPTATRCISSGAAASASRR